MLIVLTAIISLSVGFVLGFLSKPAETPLKEAQ